jgi:hydroxyacylglutathione hydrolase
MKQWSTKSGCTVTRIVSGRSNAFLLASGAAHILVDTGPRGAWNLLDARLKQLDLRRLDALILTHAHYDHAENANRIKQLYDAPVFVHKSEVYFLANGDNTVPRGTSRPVDLLVRLFARTFMRFKRYEPCACDVEVGEERDLSDLGFNARILHTPGHSAGSVSVIVDDEIALVGDCMFGVFPRTVLPPFAGDPAQMVRSWRVLLDTGCGLFLPAHGREKTREELQIDYNKRKK